MSTAPRLTQLTWLASSSCACWHAVEARLAGLSCAIPGVFEALERPVADFAHELAAQDVAWQALLEHLIPQSVEIENDRQLAELALARLVGRQRAAAAAPRIAAAMAPVEQAFRAAQPGMLDELELRSGPLREQWEARGPGLLRNIGQITDPALIADEARAVVLPPVRGGWGEAHLRYNFVRIEAVLANPHPSLPETARLAWLAARLNQDLPVYAEGLPPERFARVEPLAMLPPTLAAAAEVELVYAPAAPRLESGLLAEALACWRGLQADEAQLQGATLAQWWETYLDGPARWGVALRALDAMLEA